MPNISSQKIYSQSSSQFWQSWLFALVWNACIWFAFMKGGHNILGAFETNPVFLFIVVFPLVGLWCIIYAIQQTLACYKFGRTPLILTPFPGQIGGQCSGYLTLPVSTKVAKLAEIRLSCLQQYFASKNAGKPHQHSKLVWQDLISIKPEKYGQKSRINFSFKPPAGLPETEHENHTKHLWNIQVRVPLPGIDYDRLFELPMEKVDKQLFTIQSSASIHPPPLIEHRDDKTRCIPEINQTKTGTRFYYGYGRSKAMGVSLMLFGLFFSLFSHFFFDGFIEFLPATSSLMVVLVNLFALTFFLLGLFLIANSLSIEVSLQGVRKQQLIFGYLLEETIAAKDIVKITSEQNASSTSGNSNRVWYCLKLMTRHGQQLEVGDSLEGQSYANEISQQMITALGATWRAATLEKTLKKTKKPIPNWARWIGKLSSYIFVIALLYDLSQMFPEITGGLVK